MTEPRLKPVKASHILQAHLALPFKRRHFLWRQISLQNLQQPNRLKDSQRTTKTQKRFRPFAFRLTASRTGRRAQILCVGAHTYNSAQSRHAGHYLF